MRLKMLALIATMTPAAAQAASFNLFDGAAQATVTDRNGVTVWRTDGEADNIFIGNYYVRRSGDESELPLKEFIGEPTATVSDDTVTLLFADDRLSATLDADAEPVHHQHGPRDAISVPVRLSRSRHPLRAAQPAGPVHSDRARPDRNHQRACAVLRRYARDAHPFFF